MTTITWTVPNEWRALFENQEKSRVSKPVLNFHGVLAMCGVCCWWLAFQTCAFSLWGCENIWGRFSLHFGLLYTLCACITSISVSTSADLWSKGNGAASPQPTPILDVGLQETITISQMSKFVLPSLFFNSFPSKGVMLFSCKYKHSEHGSNWMEEVP